jgi:hypothetical protein
MPSITISFRVSGYLEDDLKTKARASGCSSMHAYARDMFLSGLAGSDFQESVTRLQEELNTISQELLELRHDLQSLMVKLLAILTDIPAFEAEQILVSSLYPDDEAAESGTLNVTD